MASVTATGKARKSKAKKTGGGESGGKDEIVEVTPKTPLERAATLQNQLLSKANACRDNAFKIRPLGMSNELVDQLSAMDTTLQDLACRLQGKIRKGKNKNSHYVELIKEVSCLHPSVLKMSHMVKK